MLTIRALAFITLICFTCEAMGVDAMPGKSPALIKSTLLSYDDQKKEITASGKVEVYQDGYLLRADRVIYQQDIDQVQAEGTVMLHEPGGNIFFGDSLILKDRLKEGMIEHFSARLRDNSVLTANHATKTANIMSMDQASYTSCPICVGKAPQWQIKASKVVLNETHQQIKYKHASFELYGLPILYLPYFSHPSPKSPSKSGLLAPRIGYSKLTGRSITLPIYLNLTPNRELLLSPTLSTEKGVVLAAEYNHLLKNGDYHLKGSVVKDKELYTTLYRYYLEGNGIFKLNSHLQTGFDVKHASDKSYLKNYYFDDREYLTTQLFTDYQKGNNSLTVEYLDFQRLRKTETNESDAPYVLPMVNAHLESDQFARGSKIFLDNNLLSLYREHGGKETRLSSKVGWSKLHVSETGHHFNLLSTVRTDFYHLRNYPTWRENVSRISPEAALDWQYPLVKRGLHYNMVILPRIMSFVAPNRVSKWDVPNEDSQFTEISASNLWQSSHSTGLDFIETGARVNYGLDSNLYFKQNYNLNFLIGQSYRFRKDVRLTPDTGMSGKFSDIVTRTVYQPSENLDLYYKARFSKDNLDVKSNEIGVLIKRQPVSLDIAYVAYDNYLPATPVKRKEFAVKAKLDLKKWELAVEARKNLSTKQRKNFTYLGWGIVYHGDCADFSTSFRKDLTRDPSINKKTNSMLLFSINLKGIN